MSIVLDTTEDVADLDISCSFDDDNEFTSNGVCCDRHDDPPVGTWKFNARNTSGKNSSMVSRSGL